MIDRALGRLVTTLTGRAACLPSADGANPMAERSGSLAPAVYRANRPYEADCSRAALIAALPEKPLAGRLGKVCAHAVGKNCRATLPVSIEIWRYCSQVALTSHHSRSLRRPNYWCSPVNVGISWSATLIRPTAYAATQHGVYAAEWHRRTQCIARREREHFLDLSTSGPGHPL